MKHNSSKILIFTSFVIIGFGLVAIYFYQSGWFNFLPSTASGFGISPPFINESGLKPGDKTKKKITILRNDTEDDKVIKLVLENKELAPWINFPMGEELIFKKGDERMTFDVFVTVPDYAATGSYKSKLMVLMNPNKTLGAVGIGLGAQVDIDLSVNGEEKAKQALIEIINDGLYERLKGKIIIKTEDLGKAYFVYSGSQTMIYLGALNADTRNAVKSIGIGISNKNFNRLFEDH